MSVLIREQWRYGCVTARETETERVARGAPDVRSTGPGRRTDHTSLSDTGDYSAP